MDGTDCPIQEPQSFNKKWWSHKLNGAGLRYEIGVSLDTGDIVWVHGPYPCGRYADVSIFRRGMKTVLDDCERVIADMGYSDDMCITPDTLLSPVSPKLHRLLRARHETVNKRLKQFAVLRSSFRHDLSFHGVCFHAIANITQYLFCDEPLFEVTFWCISNKLEINLLDLIVQIVWSKRPRLSYIQITKIVVERKLHGLNFVLGNRQLKQHRSGAIERIPDVLYFIVTFLPRHRPVTWHLLPRLHTLGKIIGYVEMYIAVTASSNCEPQFPKKYDVPSLVLKRYQRLRAGNAEMRLT